MASTHTCVVAQTLKHLHPTANDAACGYSTASAYSANHHTIADYNLADELYGFIVRLEDTRGRETVTKEEALALRGWA